ncbi:MAG: hypothetical protein KDN22_23515 [Verrucomicrobiae bacterium]|nr:hypothetical protein [Verrucomicrobiae bacterium]
MMIPFSAQPHFRRSTIAAAFVAIATTARVSADVSIETFHLEDFQAYTEAYFGSLEAAEPIESFGTNQVYEASPGSRNDPQYFIGIASFDQNGNIVPPTGNTMNGHGGNDLFDLDGVNCIVNGGEGGDRFQMLVNTMGNVVHGGNGDDGFLIAGSAGVKARGGEASTVDQLFGDDGNDVFLFDNPSRNTECTGGADADLFVILPQGGQPFELATGGSFERANIVKDFQLGIDKLAAGPDVITSIVSLNNGFDTGILVTLDLSS